MLRCTLLRLGGYGLRSLCVHTALILYFRNRHFSNSCEIAPNFPIKQRNFMKIGIIFR